ncbi:hypothetical protein H8Z59_04345 [Mycolicibacterium fortuitum]|uniref:hypothetical protein n=1 Tax=Mycolicibacterium fortuitum TaxID=1766 RepID=UPI001CDBB9FA|nr:hypothetical protein [Mycolicibacterium fortuitum]UBV22439.1 hypothetical protein H8Z59_04345 [Mycolicibacterium fortuitum]
MTFDVDKPETTPVAVSKCLHELADAIAREEIDLHKNFDTSLWGNAGPSIGTITVGAS